MSRTATETGPLRRRIRAWIQAEDFEKHWGIWEEVPARQAVSPVLGYLCSGEERIKWRAVQVMGILTARLANENMEAARDILRRLIWSLNDESGGIGWGAPEAMGEIMACHESLAREYAHLLLAYIRIDGNPLHHPALERGVLWGLGRLAQTRPHLLQEAPPHLLPWLQSHDPYHRGLAAWALGTLQAGTLSRAHLTPLLEDPWELRFLDGGKIQMVQVATLAARALREST